MAEGRIHNKRKRRENYPEIHSEPESTWKWEGKIGINTRKEEARG